MENMKTKRLVESAILLALATVLSLIKLAELPYGGSVTIASMLPVVIISYRHGLGYGLLSGAVFGVIHMSNILSGAGVLVTVMQSINAFTIGIADALIYMVSGNIFVTIVIHTLHDILAFSFDTVTDSGLMISTVSLETWVNFAQCTALGAYSIYMLCKEDVQKHIMDVWTKKWNADKQ